MEEKRKPRRWVLWLIAATLLIGYPLSFGPFVWLFERKLLSNDGPEAWLVGLFYYPLSMLVMYDVEPFASWLTWYDRLWR